MAQIKSHKDLIVWQKSIHLAKLIYQLTDQFPKSETYGLASQMRRASVAIPSNIAEGYGRKTIKDYAQFCSIAYGSALELETQLILTKELKLTKQEDLNKVEQLLHEILKMANALVGKLRQRSDP